MECRFCVVTGESSHIDETILRGLPENTILTSDDDSVVVPTLGYFVDGYCLLIPRRHRPSVADLGRQDARRIWARSADMQRALSNRFGPVFAFEHGARDRWDPSGSCLDHAHIHHVPLAAAHIRRLVEDCEMRELACDESLVDGPSVPYVWLRDERGRSFWREGRDIPSQYLRRAVARVLGIRTNQWDWRHHDERERIVADLPDLRAVFTT